MIAKRNIIRLIISACLLAIIIYLSLGLTVGAPVPPFLNIGDGYGNARWYAITQCVLSAVVLGVNYDCFKNGVVAIFKKSPNLNTLVMLGAGAPFIYSLVLTVLTFTGGSASCYVFDLHFASSAAVLTIFDIGALLEERSFNPAGGAVKDTCAGKDTPRSFSDRVAGIFVLVMILAALMTFMIWLLIDHGFNYEHCIAYAMNVLVVSCPCALALITPVVFMATTHKSASLGILYKDPEVFQRLCDINVVLLDRSAVQTDSAEAVKLLKNRGMRVALLTEDDRAAARALSAAAGIDDFLAEACAEDKLKAVTNLKSIGGCVAMVGAGIGDSEAFKQSDVGIAIGDNATENSAETVIFNKNPQTLDAVFGLSRAAVRSRKQNLCGALIVDLIAVPVAAGAFSGLGFIFDHLIAVACMCLGSVFVVLNSLRLLLYKNKKSIKGNNYEKDSFN